MMATAHSFVSQVSACEQDDMMSFYTNLCTSKTKTKLPASHNHPSDVLHGATSSGAAGIAGSTNTRSQILTSKSKYNGTSNAKNIDPTKHPEWVKKCGSNLELRPPQPAGPRETDSNPHIPETVYTAMGDVPDGSDNLHSGGEQQEKSIEGKS